MGQINDSQLWAQLSSLLPVVSSLFECRVKPSLVIELPGRYVELDYDDILRLASRFRSAGPLALTLSVSRVTRSFEEDDPEPDFTGSPSWPQNVAPFTLRCLGEYMPLEAIPHIPVTHLDIDTLVDVHCTGTIRFPTLESLKIRSSYHLVQLLGLLHAPRLAELAVTLTAIRDAQELGQAFQSCLDRCRSLKRVTLHVSYSYSETSREAQVLANQLSSIADLADREKIDVGLRLKVQSGGVPDESTHPLRPLNRCLSRVVSYIEHLEIDLDTRHGVQAFTENFDLSHVKSATLNYSHFVQDTGLIPILQYYLIALQSSHVHTSNLQLSDIWLPTIKILPAYLAKTPTLRQVNLNCLILLAQRNWTEVNDIMTQQEETTAWLEFAEGCSKLDIAYNITWR